MAPRTRSTTNSPVKRTAVAPSTVIEPKHSPTKIVIAPRHITTNARFLSLRQPRDDTLKRFLFCPSYGLFELKRTSVPTLDPRSIILIPSNLESEQHLSPTEPDSTTFRDGFINRDAEILTATPYDLAFILLKTVAPQYASTKKSLFQPLDDILEMFESEDKSLAYIMKNGQTLMEEGMSTICDSIDAGEEKMFRYNEDKVVKFVLDKAERVAKLGLPASLEDRFVTRVLEAPMMSIKREDTSVLTISQPVLTEDNGSQDEGDSQSTTASTTASAVFSEVSIASTVMTAPEETATTEFTRLQRIRVAYNFISASYLPSFIATRIAARLGEASSPINFKPLDEHLKQLSVLRAAAAASRSMSDFSRKRGLDNDEIAEEKAEKKRRIEEEEKKRKANESRGVRDLKKVNVTGMKKMSDFFAKKPATTKAKN